MRINLKKKLLNYIIYKLKINNKNKCNYYLF